MVDGPAIGSFPQLKFPSGSGSGGGTLNFHQLYIFFAVASHRSFSRAAESLNITQPAVSIQVQELEKFLGAALFHRRTRGLRITEVGETVFAYAQQIFSLSGKLLETLEEIHNLQTGRLSLGASTTPGEYLLPMAVGRFRQLYPGISVDLYIANTRVITQRILNQELDLGMVGSHPIVGQDELGLIDYLEDEIVLVAAPNHPLAQAGEVTARQVVDAGLILREPGSATRTTAEQYFEQLGITPTAALSLGSNQALKQAAMAGGGVAVISRMGVTAETRAGMLVTLPVTGWDCHRPLTLIYPKDRQLSPSKRAFLEYLQTQFNPQQFSHQVTRSATKL
jgi:DNA-binding transcriptional LysR family regulator